MSKLRSLYLDDTVCIPQSKTVGDGPLHDTRDSAFHVNDGWDIRETMPGIFVITNDLMGDRSVTLGGYGYSYERAAERLAKEPGGLQEVAPPDPALASPKERDTAAHVNAGEPRVLRRRKRV